ncbi:c-di-GMP-binding flagellar brake protein YcgR, contains PilZNR and PilZ domains [Salinibacillus kushneri]|uniref:C-di-GMP-binding flagellar brake protein YcgR, contains PilZNR and PilZ domains n=1 Tax=Salinibacillus kushneri TaxID=237682 RepID=A0A1I0I259_9BACI|nr:flagellar brake domain-containing protein [Salinibacillus kushneri]SET89700.1 c-di-GMP-binding flagellar brake protein YcgR, contains PilZNR and PilZ domains [Salinibacillus kushneri]
MEIGTILSLSFLEENGQSIKSYTSKIMEMNERECLIQYPISDETGRTSFFMEGSRFTAQFVGKDEVVYSFQTKVIKREKVNSIPVLALLIPEEDSFTLVQRRDYVRVMTALDVSIHPQKQSIPKFTTSTIDISGGGLAIQTPNNVKFEEKDQLDLWIVLPFKNMEYQYVHATAKVIRQMKKQTDLLVTSLMFDNISTHDREQIIRFCFQKQIEKKRLPRNRHKPLSSRG